MPKRKTGNINTTTGCNTKKRQGKQYVVDNDCSVTMRGDTTGLHLSSKEAPVTASVTPSGGELTAANRNFSARVSKQVQQLAVTTTKDRTYTATKTPTGYSAGVSGKRGSLNVSSDNINASYNGASVSTGKGGTGVSYRNVSAYKRRGGGGEITAAKNTRHGSGRVTVGTNPKQGNFVKLSLNIPT